MIIKRAQKIFNPRTGEKKYIKLEVECTKCGNSRIVDSIELDEALKHSKNFLVKFKCRCGDPEAVKGVHRHWLEWHRSSFDLFPPW
jgi:hypothetical protein